MKSSAASPTAFDCFADNYDNTFTNTRLGKLLRGRVWQKLADYFSSGQHVLELACGTGEDAVWLAQQGLRITATDGSAEMVKLATAKAQTGGVEDRVAVSQVSLQAVADGYFAEQFDGVFSNFGGLNTMGRWRSLAQGLAKVVRPGGCVILVPMGPFCPWEIAWYLAHGQPQVAFRRFRRHGTVAHIGETTIPVWYPSARQLQADFGPWFDHFQSVSLGLWLPPSYLDHVVRRWPNLFTLLNRFETATAHLTGSWGDHYMLIFRRSTGQRQVRRKGET